MKHLLKTLCSALFAAAALHLGAADPVPQPAAAPDTTASRSSTAPAGQDAFLETVPLISESVSIDIGAEQLWHVPVLKPLNSQWEGKRAGLHIRAFAQSPVRTDDWTMIMQIRIGDTILERYNELKQPRLVNRSDVKNIIAGPNRKYSGTSWYNRYYRSWDVGYGSGITPGTKFSRWFREDITDYLFDIDDLIRVGEPFTVTIANIGDRNDRLLQELKQRRQTLPLVVVTAEVVIYATPENRAALTKAVPPPAEEAIRALHERIPRAEASAPEAVRAELLELGRAEQLFPQCARHAQVTNFLPGHLWLGYDSTLGKADRLIPILDQAVLAGVSVVRVPESWADPRGAGAFQTADDKADKDFRRLIELCHQRKLKLIVHVSPGLVRRNRQYSRAWEYSDPVTAPGEDGRQGQVCPGSPEWRSFFFAEVRKLFERYDVDGICVEPGINSAEELRCTQSDHVHAFREASNPAVSTLDLLTRLSILCRRSGKLCYILADGLPNLASICDGQYIGRNTSLMRNYAMTNAGYTGGVWFLPMTRSFTYYSMREVYGSVMATGHFPVFLYDERGDWKNELQYFRCFLPLWKAMNRPGTHLYRRITETPLMEEILPQLTLTAYVNTSTYLVVYNGGTSVAECVFAQELTDLESGEKAVLFRIPERDFRIFLLPPAEPGDLLPPDAEESRAEGDGQKARTPGSAVPGATGPFVPGTRTPEAGTTGKDVDDAPKSLMTPRRYRKRK